MRLSILGLVIAASVVGYSLSHAAATPEKVITIEHSRFDPAAFEVERGATVTFVIRNDDPIDHEFIIGDEVVQALHETGTEAHHGAKPGEISIPAGTTRRTTFTFTERGKLIFGCHLPAHYDYGMRGVISVTG